MGSPSGVMRELKFEKFECQSNAICHLPAFCHFFEQILPQLRWQEKVHIEGAFFGVDTNTQHISLFVYSEISHLKFFFVDKFFLKRFEVEVLSIQDHIDKRSILSFFIAFEDGLDYLRRIFEPSLGFELLTLSIRSA